MPRTARCLGGLGATAISLLLTGPTLAAGALEGPTTTQPTNWTAIVMFFAFVLFTLAITKWAASKTKSAADFYAAGGGITGFQNSLAIAGDYMSAASFLGISGLVFVSGYDGLIYSVGFLVGWPVVLFLIAERLRNLGKFTFADVASYRLQQTPIRILSAVGTLTVVAFYLIAQMVGAGKLIQLLFGLPYLWALIIVGVLMTAYVTFGGMLATTWVQIIKACMLLAGASFMAFMVLWQFGFSPEAMFKAATEINPKGLAIMSPGSLVTDPISAISLGLALMFGTAGLPHILMRFFTVADAKAARKSVFYATGFIGYFYILTFIIGFGAITLVMTNPAFYTTTVGADGALVYDKIKDLLGGTNMAAIHLSEAVGGNLFLGLHLGCGLRHHPGRGRRPDARRCLRGQPRSLCLGVRQGPRHRRRGDQGLQDRDHRVGHHGHLSGLRVRAAERRLHGRPRLRHRRQLQLPGAADVDVLEGPDHQGCSGRRPLGPDLGRHPGRARPHGVGEGAAPSGRLGAVPLREPGAVLDDHRLRRHLAVFGPRPQPDGQERG